MKIVSSDAMTRIDRRTQAEFAVPPTILMEDAGVKAWALARAAAWGGHAPRGRVVFLAGKGNNGGDAFVMARQAAVENIRTITVVLAAGRPESGTDPHTMLAMCDALGIECLTWPAEEADVRRRCAEAAWFFDGIAGTGISGALRAPLSDLVELVNASPGSKIAIDVPSGVGDGYRSSYPAVRADITLTMGLPKLCLYLPRTRGLCGRIIVVPVGFPPALVEDAALPGAVLERGAWRRLAPPIPADTYKNRRGHLAVFAGSRGTTGAAWLCASAAARSRVGLVTLFVDSDAYPVVAPRLASVMCRPWDAPARQAATEWNASPYSAALVGPGWGMTEAKENWLERVTGTHLSGVIDADALSLLGRIVARGRIDLGGRWVLTPHPGEFSRLTGVSRDDVLDDPVPLVLEASARYNAVIVLKGSCTIVAVPQGKYWILDGQIAALATGGSGDVLAGIIAAGIAGGMGPLDAALFGVSLHASVGRLAARRLGWFLAEDLVPLISRLLAKS
jgi:NAD(P)H-hydrate epimerase